MGRSIAGAGPYSHYPGPALFGVCRDQGHLPDDYLDRPANQRETILTLPGLTQADIAEFYDCWTDIRVADTPRRYGSAYAAENRAEITDAIEISATAG